ncbi:response regulator [bacterium]|nr:response regulator [bacterium]
MSETLQIRKADGSPYRFMIVDDSEFILKSLKVTISLLGGEVVGESKDGTEAIDIYKKVRPDVVTCDIVMPTMSGVEVVKHLVNLDPEAKVIMVSSLGHKEMIEQAVSRGAKYFIVKPFKPAEAAMAIGAVIKKLFRH